MNNLKKVFIIGDTIEEITTIENTYLNNKKIKVIHRELCADEYGDVILLLVITDNRISNWLSYKQLGGQLCEPISSTNHLLN
jgi:hypothetical protein